MKSTVNIRIEEAAWIKILEIKGKRVKIESVVAGERPKTRWMNIEDEWIIGLTLEFER